ncbi:MAG: aminotransferase class III-fold pyridoxal phosphate-dependent enzyme, partial [Actinomycetota bacterium]
QELQASHPLVGDVRGKGLILGIELVAPGTKDPEPDAATAVLEECRTRGLLIGKGGLYGNVVRMAPPLSVTLEEADEGFGSFAAAIATVGG